ncbi:MAG: hypothetical protein HKN14_09825 [Marinicaulis sp.]|nr:hypothetical protein [Marinicaulis sp.]NNE41200.1 hypothetical protein [Marinicaulis sp.]NNL88372.1 hypothetical protein [Marinicaulis sp.]
MADGAARSSVKRRSMMAFAEDADPRFATKIEDSPKKSLFRGKPKQPARVAFTGEEFGFGYQATERFIERARREKTVADGGVTYTGAQTEREYDDASKNSRFDYNSYVPQPLRTKEQALMAVKSQTADFALVPFYNPYAGYDFETLRAIGSLFTILGVEQVEATDNLCLAVHESQLYDLIQSSHPGTGFSALQRRMRKAWGETDATSGNEPGKSYEAEMPRAGLPIDMSDQKLIRDRIDRVFAGPEAARRCKSKLDGLRAIGVEVQETAQMIEPHRELAKLARGTTNQSRQTNTFFDPVTGETRFFSSLGAESQAGNLFGMVLPYEVAMRSSDYVIIDHNFDDAAPDKTRFLVVENNPDHSLYEDRYRTTDARTRYWYQRMNAIAGSNMSLGAGVLKILGFAATAAAIMLALVGLYGVGAISGVVDANALSWLPASLTAQGALVLAAMILVAAFIFMSAQGRGHQGVRVMFRFKRDGTAASIGDVENFLRNYGVRHAVVRMDEDSGRNAPSAMVLDVEFDPEDFSYGPFSALFRRLRGSVVNGALKKVFQRWKNRGVTVLAAVPFEPEQAQLPKHKARRWWSEAVSEWTADFVETMFVRFSRIAAFYILPAFLVWFVVWKVILNG